MSLLSGHPPDEAGESARPMATTRAAANRLSLHRFISSGMTSTAAKVAVVTIGGDLIFAALRATQLTTPFVQNPMFRLSEDGSYPEFFQYAKFVFIAALFAWLARSRRTGWLLAWTASFLFLAADDAFTIHEGIGARYAPTVEPLLPAGVDAVAVTEFGYLGLVGLGIAAVAGLGMLLSSGLFRRVSLDMIVLLAFGGFFAVSVDLVHGLTEFGFVGNTLLAIAEDGGEMMVASFIAIYTAMVVSRNGEMPHWLTSIRRLRG